MAFLVRFSHSGRNHARWNSTLASVLDKTNNINETKNWHRRHPPYYWIVSYCCFEIMAGNKNNEHHQRHFLQKNITDVTQSESYSTQTWHVNNTNTQVIDIVHCDWICKKGSYTSFQFCNFDEEQLHMQFSYEAEIYFHLSVMIVKCLWKISAC